MAFGQLTNCPRCGKLFVKGTHDLCPNCLKDIEAEYQLCADYLRENRGATIYELSEATGVSIRQIKRFIQEGRISIKDNPNMGYPCESCGTIIQEGNLCPSCMAKLNRDIKRTVQEMEKENKKETEADKNRSYNMQDRIAKKYE